VEIAGATQRILSDAELRASLRVRALERSKLFTWEKCAKETLTILSGLGAVSETAS
jgi:glycosyltransferase involved in cell wall biosynthesis